MTRKYTTTDMLNNWYVTILFLSLFFWSWGFRMNSAIARCYYFILGLSVLILGLIHVHIKKDINRKAIIILHGISGIMYFLVGIYFFIYYGAQEESLKLILDRFATRVIFLLFSPVLIYIPILFFTQSNLEKRLPKI